jgi:hypothetical protein
MMFIASVPFWMIGFMSLFVGLNLMASLAKMPDGAHRSVLAYGAIAAGHVLGAGVLFYIAARIAS